MRDFLYLRTASGGDDCSFLSKDEGTVISRFFNNASHDKSIYKVRWSEEAISVNAVMPLRFSFVGKLNEQRMKAI